jgi:hypothetical protein
MRVNAGKIKYQNVPKDLYYFLFMATAIVLGQSRTREIGLITENDLYNLQERYTNRMGDFYRFNKE